MQSSGRGASPHPDGSKPGGRPYEPTDDDLLHALEEFERQEQTAALGEATDELREVSQREEEQLNEGDSVLEHRRRRVHAAFGTCLGGPSCH